jgi:hypothetical protein
MYEQTKKTAAGLFLVLADQDGPRLLASLLDHEEFAQSNPVV